MVRLPHSFVRAAAALTVVVLAACGSSGGDTKRDVPAVPEPAAAPAPSEHPAGRVVAVGRTPEGVVVDATGGLVAVAVRDPGELVVLDLDGRQVRRVGLSAPARHLSAFSSAGTVLVPAERADQLQVVDVRAGVVTTTVRVGDHPHDATAVGSRVFAGDEFGGTVHVVEGGRVVRILEAPLQPGGVAAGDGVVAVVGVRGRRLEAFDTTSLKSLGTVKAGVGPTHVVADGRRFYVADTQGNELLVFEVQDGRVRQVARADAAGTPYGMAVDAGRRHLWVTLTASNRLVEYDIGGKTPRALRNWPTVRQPNSVAVEPRTGRVYVTGTADGVVQMIDG